MWILIGGGLLITLPALIVAAAFIGQMAMVAALASFAINSIPFLAAFFILRAQKKRGKLDIEH